MTRKFYKCAGCGNVTEHQHLHDTAHGIAETHMAGTERFVCVICRHTVHATDDNAKDFPFVLDGKPPTTRTVT